MKIIKLFSIEYSTAKKKFEAFTLCEIILSQVAQREKERQEAIARGEPDPELKRKRFFLVSPQPLNYHSSH